MNKRQKKKRSKMFHSHDNFYSIKKLVKRYKRIVSIADSSKDKDYTAEMTIKIQDEYIAIINTKII